MGDTPNVLAPASHQAKDIASLFWWMMGGAWLGLGLVVALLVLSYVRRGRVAPDHKPNERAGWIVVVGLGIATPVLVIAALFVVSDLFVIKTTEAPAAAATRLTVDVTGHQWWWEVRYPGTRAVTANELHIPVHTPVRLQVDTADVIHSVWVPELNRKIDTIPGQTNAIELYADRVGVFRGECAEFCGLQHAHMGLLVYADPPDVFRRWLANEERPASVVAGSGHDLFVNGTCAACHAIRGTSATGFTGPDLTHVAARATLAAVAIANDRASLAQWLENAQHVKPGNRMPDLRLSQQDVRALVDYLEQLR